MAFTCGFYLPTPAWDRLVWLEAARDELLARVEAAQGDRGCPVAELISLRLAQAWDAAQAEEQADIATHWQGYPALLEGPNPYASGGGFVSSG